MRPCDLCFNACGNVSLCGSKWFKRGSENSFGWYLKHLIKVSSWRFNDLLYFRIHGYTLFECSQYMCVRLYPGLKVFIVQKTSHSCVFNIFRQWCSAPDVPLSSQCVFVCVCVLLPQTRCLISPVWVTWRWTPGRMPRSSVSPRAKFLSLSPSCWRWEQQQYVWVCCFCFFRLSLLRKVKPACQHLDNSTDIVGRSSSTIDTKNMVGISSTVLSAYSYSYRTHSCWQHSH